MAKSIDFQEIELVGELLRRTARAGETITYGEVASELGLHIAMSYVRARIGRILQEVCASEVQDGMPMLGSVVVAKATGLPGKGYFEIARRLGRQNGLDDPTFHAEELAKVHAAFTSTAPGSRR